MDLGLNNLQWLMCHKTKPNPDLLCPVMVVPVRVPSTDQKELFNHIQETITLCKQMILN